MTISNNDYNKYVLPWLTIIEKMKKNKSYKPVLLLSIILEIEKGNISDNRIMITDSLVNRFDNFYREIGNKQALKKIFQPFYYLKTDLWQLKWKIPTSTKVPSSIRNAKERIKFAFFNDNLFEALVNDKTRNYIKERLIYKTIEDIKHLDSDRNTSFTVPSNINQIVENYFGMTTKIDRLEATVDTSQIEFAREKVLQEFIVENWDKISYFKEKGLKIYKGMAYGVEFDTKEAGKIDILAEDYTKRSLTVIELKKGRGSERQLGQVLRYMGWIRANLAQKRFVNGLLIASKFKKSIKFALDELEDVSLLEYHLSFDLKEPFFS